MFTHLKDLVITTIFPCEKRMAEIIHIHDKATKENAVAHVELTNACKRKQENGRST